MGGNDGRGKSPVELTIEQKKAIALAKARLRLQEPEQREPIDMGEWNDPIDVPFTDIAIKHPKDWSLSASDVAGGAIEPTLSLGSGLIGGVTSGITGLNEMLNAAVYKYTGLKPIGAENLPDREKVDPVQIGSDRIKEIASAMTYSPKTEGGKAGLNVVSYPFQKVAEGAKWAGEKTLDITDSPEAATAVDTTLQIVPAILAGKYLSKHGSLPEAITKPTTAAVKKVGTAISSTRNLLPGHHAQRAKVTMNKLAGEDKAAILKALDEAKPGQSAGQAASDIGRREFLALDDVVKSRLPTKYGRIAEASLQKILSDLKKIGKTPEELARAKSILKTNADEAYSAVSANRVNPKSNAEMIADAAMKAKDLASKAKLSKESALQDWGRFKTMEGHQGARAIRKPPEIGPLTEKLTGKKTPTGEQMGNIDGYPRPPAKFTPQRANQLEAAKAASEAKSIAQQRALAERAMTDVSEGMLLNMTGESGIGLNKFLTRPSIKKAIIEAKRAAAETGSYFPKNPGDKFSVANLQRIKRALKEDITLQQKSTKGLAKTKEGELTGTVDQFTDWLRSKSKGFAHAEDLWAKEVKPVNQMKIGQKLMNTLNPDIPITGKIPPGDAPRVTKFINLVDKMKKDGRWGDLSAEQQMSVDGIVKKFAQDKRLASQSKEGLQAARDTIEQALKPLEAPPMLSTKMMVFRNIMNRLKGYATEDTINLIAENWDKPKVIAQLMRSGKINQKAYAEYNKLMDEAVMAGALIQSEKE